MRAKIALGSGMGVVVDVDGVVGTRLHAHLAPDAVLVIKVDDTVFSDEERRGRARLNARSVGAVVAPHDAHLACC